MTQRDNEGRRQQERANEDDRSSQARGEDRYGSRPNEREGSSYSTSGQGGSARGGSNEYGSSQSGYGSQREFGGSQSGYGSQGDPPLTGRCFASVRVARRIWRTKRSKRSKQIRFSRLAGLRFPIWITGRLRFATEARHPDSIRKAATVHTLVMARKAALDRAARRHSVHPTTAHKVAVREAAMASNVTLVAGAKAGMEAPQVATLQWVATTRAEAWASVSNRARPTSSNITTRNIISGAASK